MIPNQKKSLQAGLILSLFVIINVVVLEHAFTLNENWYWALIITFPVFIAAVIYHKKKKKADSNSL